MFITWREEVIIIVNENKQWWLKLVKNEHLITVIITKIKRPMNWIEDKYLRTVPVYTFSDILFCLMCHEFFCSPNEVIILLVEKKKPGWG